MIFIITNTNKYIPIPQDLVHCLKKHKLKPMAAAIESESKNAVPSFPGVCARDYIAAKLISNSRIPSEPLSLSLDVWHIVLGSFMYAVDFRDPKNTRPRNHECPQLVKNLMHNPGSQLSPAVIESIIQMKCKSVNIHQHIMLIDPMYAENANSILVGLLSVYPTFETDETLTIQGAIPISDNASIPYTSILEPVLITNEVGESDVQQFIEDITSYKSSRINHFALINIMDCTSHTMRYTWANNEDPNVYLAMPDCFINDASINYLPIITAAIKSPSASAGAGADAGFTMRWCNADLDQQQIPAYQAISPGMYNFLVNGYRSKILKIYLVGWVKISSVLKITLEYRLSNGILFRFSTLTLEDFITLWTLPEFRNKLMNFTDKFFEHNIIRFINLLIDPTNLVELSHIATHNLTEALDAFIQPKIQQLNDYFPDERPLDVRHFNMIADYLHHHDIHL